MICFEDKEFKYTVGLNLLCMFAAFFFYLFACVKENGVFFLFLEKKKKIGVVISFTGNLARLSRIYLSTRGRCRTTVIIGC